jgi:hypothetical protein
MKKNLFSLPRVYNLGMNYAMGAAVLFLPLTSLPALSVLMGGTMVAPPTIVFIFILFIGWLPAYLLRGGKFPGEMGPFFVFVVLALMASAAAFVINFPSFRGSAIQNAEASAVLTLAVGSATYVIVSIWNQESGRLVRTLRLINISGVILLAWSLLQLAQILLNSGDYPDRMVQIQSLLSTRSLLDFGFRGRVGGFAFEPSWQAHLLNMVYLPYWLAATVTGYSVSKKLWRLSAENILLVSGIIILYFTVSRIGLLALLVAFAFLFYRLNTQFIKWFQKRLQRRSSSIRLQLDKLIPGLSILVVLLAYLAAVAGLVLLWSRFDQRIANLLSLREIPSSLLELAFSVNFGERVVYWSIGWSVFARYPLLGVGLGNTGFFFQHYLPSIAYRSPEIINLLDQAMVIPNVKSFWIRLLSETGLVGFSVFAAWQIVLWRAGAFLRAKRFMFFRTLGWMGAFAILAFICEGFSIDSFALPYLWVAMGLLTAASALARREANEPIGDHLVQTQ